jgi:hypothetical protein
MCSYDFGIVVELKPTFPWTGTMAATSVRAARRIPFR